MILLAVAVVVVVGAVVLATSVFGGSSSKAPAPNKVAPAPGSGVGTAAAGSVVPSSVTVAVLNGTSVPGLARTVANSLQHSSYKIGTVTNAPVQQHATTLVAYAPGGRRDAQAVARAIGIDPASITPEDPSTGTVAGPNAIVVVTVGADRQGH